MRFSALDTGDFSILAGSVDASQATDAVLTTADGAATLTRGGVGDYTITFGAAFRAAPVAFGSVVDATFAATDGAHVVEIAAVAATDIQFRILDTGGSAANGAVADLDFHFVVMGSRNR